MAAWNFGSTFYLRRSEYVPVTFRATKGGTRLSSALQRRSLSVTLSCLFKACGIHGVNSESISLYPSMAIAHMNEKTEGLSAGNHNPRAANSQTFMSTFQCEIHYVGFRRSAVSFKVYEHLYRVFSIKVESILI
jgi:hypothetical protein